MPYRRTSRRLVSLAVFTALAAAGGPLALPAVAAPGQAAPDEAAAALPRVPSDARIVSGGPGGFLMRANSSDQGQDLTWTRYSDGSVTRMDFPLTSDEEAGAMSDTVVEHGRPVRLHHMDTGTTTEIDVFGMGYSYLGAVGTTLITLGPRPGSTPQLHLLSDPRKGMTDRAVSGLPRGILSDRVVAYADGAFVYEYATGDKYAPTLHHAVVDVASARIVSTYRVWNSWGEVALSGTHIAWIGSANGVSGTVVRTAKRGSSTVSVTQLGRIGDGPFIGLLDGWTLLGSQRDEDVSDHALYARPLGGGAPRKVLDAVDSRTAGLAPGGALLVRGGTAAHGDGLYRITRGSDGLPRAEIVASTGKPTKVTLVSRNIPATVDFDRTPTVVLGWKLSRDRVRTTFVLRNLRTGLKGVYSDRNVRPPEETGNGFFELRWHGALYDGVTPATAPNGEYEWQLTAKPIDGIGPDLVTKGRLTVNRPPAPHDLTDDGTPDLLARTPDGHLISENTYLSGGEEPALRSQTDLGSYWGKYTALVAAGNAGGSQHADLLARDAAGVLWLYTGKGDGKFAARSKIGAGWNQYNELTAGGDVTGDGKADLLARDKDGVLWLHRGTGTADAPYATRKRISSGWNQYDALISAGNIAGGAAGDLLARDKAGVLWLHRGRGDGTFGTRSRVGSGWDKYKDLVAWGDADKDGTLDLYARDKDGESWFYRGTGEVTAPFRSRKALNGLTHLPQEYTEVL
ncbi:VCBS repeat-containing protein [Streptomyces sp. TBY4]|uniref:FG-GAP repeat domain-containing protein n=1 Tax=Streptomyces sp. TBY4 TaxID=2962030 RepID=UPI0020B6ADCD|nr:VCBS repeat-containing protein [Streptomyces sp. TBY4]MCP3753898.1 VCBS repeat-containing protein [Streptomyces sp. TBY4]